MIELQPTDRQAPWPLRSSTLGFNAEGLFWAGHVRLARMALDESGRMHLAVVEDSDRLLALLSIAARRRVEPTALRHVEAAAKLWDQGDRALANLRLVFAGLGRLDDPGDLDRMALAEYLLDAGVAPAALAKELGLDREPTAFDKYWEDQPRVPAGHGRESGRWTDTNDVAMIDGPPENEEQRKEDHVLPRGRPQVTVSGGRIFDPADGLLTGAGAGKEFVAKAVAAAVKARENVGPGRGPVYGTAVHTEFKKIIEGMRDPKMLVERSYLNGKSVTYGTRGSIRLDCMAGTPDEPTHIVELKTGDSKWTPAREQATRSHLPRKCRYVPIYVVRP